MQWHSVLGELRSMAIALPGSRNMFSRLQKALSDLANVEFLDVGPTLCPDQTCSPFVGNQPAYYDDDHLSIVGSIALAKAFLASEQGQDFAGKLAELGAQKAGNP